MIATTTAPYKRLNIQSNSARVIFLTFFFFVSMIGPNAIGTLHHYIA
jgi:hypothetical protein